MKIHKILSAIMASVVMVTVSASAPAAPKAGWFSKEGLRSGTVSLWNGIQATPGYIVSGLRATPGFIASKCNSAKDFVVTSHKASVAKNAYLTYGLEAAAVAAILGGAAYWMYSKYAARNAQDKAFAPGKVEKSIEATQVNQIEEYFVKNNVLNLPGFSIRIETDRIRYVDLNNLATDGCKFKDVHGKCVYVSKATILEILKKAPASYEHLKKAARSPFNFSKPVVV